MLSVAIPHGSYYIGNILSGLWRSTELKQILATVDTELLAIKLGRDSFVILPEHKRTEIAGEVVRGKLEWINDSWKDR